MKKRVKEKEENQSARFSLVQKVLPQFLSKGPAVCLAGRPDGYNFAFLSPYK